MKKLQVVLIFLLSSAFLGLCRGAVLFDGYTPQEPQEIRLNMQHIEQPKENTLTITPFCSLILNETEPNQVNLTIRVHTTELNLQTQNFETWLSIDNEESEKLDGIFSYRCNSLTNEYERYYYVTLNELGDGFHLIKIRVAGEYFSAYGLEGGNYDCEGNVSFILDNKFPTIGNISIQNTTYFKNHMELSCTSSEPCPWIAYSLDNQSNVTIKTADDRTNEMQQAKTNLTDLSEGSHNLTVYSCDMAGNVGSSQTVTFTVEEPPEPFSAVIVAAAVISVVVLVAAIFLIARRRA